MNDILEIKNLTKYYGKIKGIENVSFCLNQGEIFGFIGPNGAGKSTTIRTILNLINKTSGDILFEDKELKKDDLEIKKQIGYLPSEINLYDDLTVKKMLDYHESFYEKDIHKNRERLVKLFNLDESKKIEDLSLGNKKKLGIILTFMHEPKLAILDEPTSGLDPLMQNTFYNLLLEEKKKGTTIFYSTHILNEVPKICDRVGIIKNGKLIKVSSVDEIDEMNLLSIKIVSKELKKIIKTLKIKEYEINDDNLTFKYNKNIDELIKNLASYTIDKLLIEEASIEDIFMHYYK